MGRFLLLPAAQNIRSKVNDPRQRCASEFSRSVIYFPRAGARVVQCHAAAREHARAVDVLAGAGFDMRLLGETERIENEGGGWQPSGHLALENGQPADTH